tara:strand:- start:121 stop:249 length:129 start_codon:yes stop_codon:yes gene_type:complete
LIEPLGPFLVGNGFWYKRKIMLPFVLVSFGSDFFIPQFGGVV